MRKLSTAAVIVGALGTGMGLDAKSISRASCIARNFDKNQNSFNEIVFGDSLEKAEAKRQAKRQKRINAARNKGNA